jgi:Zn-dependent protease
MQRFDFSRNEIKDLITAFIVLTVAFSILCAEDLNGILPIMPVIMMSVGLATIVHELAYKISAMHFNYWAEYKAFFPGLFFALITSFSGFVYAAPGAVFIYGNATEKEDGIICLSGVMSNLLLAILCIFFIVSIKMQIMPISFFYTDLAYSIFEVSFLINVSMAVFNSLPIGNADGAVIYRWNLIIWMLTVILTFFIIWVGKIHFQI